MQFPLGLYDISLWLAISAILLLATSVLIDPHYSQSSLVIEKSHLKTASLILGLLFLITVAIKFYQIIITL